LTTETWVARLDGSDMRLVFSDGPRESIRAFPVAFSPDGTTLYLDYQPDVIGDATLFRQYAGLFALDLASGEVIGLTGEPGCFCGAGIGAGKMVRLTLASGLGGFDLRVVDLERGTQREISGLGLGEFTQGGDVLIAPDGRYAVYALAAVRGFGTSDPSVATAVVLVDLIAMTQRQLFAPLDRVVRPLMWTEDSSAVLLYDPARSVTLKAILPDGAPEAIADAVFLGTLFTR
jgi:hypothetical protein